MEHTLTYKISEKGFHSFYSFIPESIVGLNQDLFTFKGGNLYIHNDSSVNRNTFYGNYTPSKMKAVFNIDPLESKLVKAFKITGTAAWDVTLITDIQDTGFIEKEWFKIKENSYFAFVRNSGTNPAADGEFKLRRFDGIGVCSSVTNVGTDYTITLPDVGSRISIGDFVYNAPGPSYDNPTLAGKVTDKTATTIVIDTSISGATPPSTGDFIIYTKENISESNGVVGQYCVFEMTNDSTGEIELFAVEGEIMKSFR